MHKIPCRVVNPFTIMMIVIVGGGSVGITVAARLVRAGKAGQITLIEPGGKHYYQPLWTLVGGGITTSQMVSKTK